MAQRNSGSSFRNQLQESAKTIAPDEAKRQELFNSIMERAEAQSPVRYEDTESTLAALAKKRLNRMIAMVGTFGAGAVAVAAALLLMVGSPTVAIDSLTMDGSIVVIVDEGIPLGELPGGQADAAEAEAPSPGIPVLESYTVKSGKLTVVLSDPDGINWDSVVIIGTDGAVCLPQSTDPDAGTATFAVPKEDATLQVENLRGNRAQAQISVD